MGIEKIKILGAVLELPAKSHFLFFSKALHNLEESVNVLFGTISNGKKRAFLDK